LGIRYAEPPVGELRWRPPQPPRPWHTVLDATKFGNHCLQTGAANQTGASEDCLFLNVYVPRKRPQSCEQSQRLKPVMVWIYGGTNTTGASETHDPTPLVETGGVVAVTLNYRVGRFGFLAHPGLDREGHPAVNYGILDQQLALKWVRSNIERFGGDPRNVTIFGESAGGLNVTTHLVSPLSAGLFHRAIIQSGAYQLDTPSLAASEALGVSFADRVGCTNQTAACLRALPAAGVLAHVGEIWPQPATYNQSTVDGEILVETQRSALQAGRINRVPVLQGADRDEGRGTPRTMTLAEHQRDLQSITTALGKDPARALAIYSLEHYPNAYEAASAALGDRFFSCHAQVLSRLLSQWVPTYAYEFADAGASAFGATHAAELKYLFSMNIDLSGVDANSLELIKAINRGPDTLPAASQRLAHAMRVSWTAFAKAGNPKSALIPHWPLSSKDIQLLQPSRPGVISHSNFSARHRCDFWN
jgi:para-nitrobenzyl esterase